eukprot:1216623-Rhodomonas_salina.1
MSVCACARALRSGAACALPPLPRLPPCRTRATSGASLSGAGRESECVCARRAGEHEAARGGGGLGVHRRLRSLPGPPPDSPPLLPPGSLCWRSVGGACAEEWRRVTKGDGAGGGGAGAVPAGAHQAARP